MIMSYIRRKLFNAQFPQSMRDIFSSAGKDGLEKGARLNEIIKADPKTEFVIIGYKDHGEAPMGRDFDTFWLKPVNSDEVLLIYPNSVPSNGLDTSLCSSLIKAGVGSKVQFSRNWLQSTVSVTVLEEGNEHTGMPVTSFDWQPEKIDPRYGELMRSHLLKSEEADVVPLGKEHYTEIKPDVPRLIK